nr:uncharacterized protein LOC119185494 isoform X1 [Rhipicephalus microplus]
MVQERLYTTVLVFSSMTLVSALFARGVSKRRPDIKEFLCTRERIWTYKTNTSEYVQCKVDRVTSISQTSIIFRRYYFRDEQHHWTKKKLQGIFSAEQCDVMQVRNLDNIFLSKEKLLYMTRKYGCAVMMVTQAQHGREPYYELRVWESFLKQRPNVKCVREFQKHTHKGKTIRTVLQPHPSH